MADENGLLTREKITEYINLKQVDISISRIFTISIWYGLFVCFWDLITQKLSIFNEYTLTHMGFINAVILIPIGVILILYFPLVYMNAKYRMFLIEEAGITLSNKEQKAQEEKYSSIKALKIGTLILLFLNLIFIGTLKLNAGSVFEANYPIDNKKDLLVKVQTLDCKKISFGLYHETPTFEMNYQSIAPKNGFNNEETTIEKNVWYSITPALKEELKNKGCSDFK